MTAPVFLADLTGTAAGDTLVLTGPEGRHAASVRRLAVGERVDLTDGSGGFVECTVRSVLKDGLELELLLRKDSDRPNPTLTVVQALPKGDRGELAVDLLTEVGVDHIVPWAAARCVTQWRGERGERALAKWRAHAREAGKQSRRPWFPLVEEQRSTREVCGLVERAALAVVLHESAPGPLRPEQVPYDAGVLLIVGPEGGITDEELAAYVAAGAVAARIGPTVMRTSTAGVAAAAVVLAAIGRWA